MVPSHIMSLRLGLDREKRRTIETAIDISEALDNCFFHAFALYYLANHRELPINLFENYDHDDHLVDHLKSLIPNSSVLEACFDSTHIFEKTMVLGIFFRSWFVANLLYSDENKKHLFAVVDSQGIIVASESGISFLTLLTIYQDAKSNEADRASLDEMCQDISLFQANADYIRNFSGNVDTHRQQIKAYWDTEGYSRYCRYLAQSGVKIFHGDISPILTALNIPYAIYSRTTETVIITQLSSTENPRFELAIDPGAAHYYLLLTEQTRALLLEYHRQRARYKSEREAILANETDDKVALCADNPNWFLAAILPAGFMGPHSPIELMVERLEKRLVSEIATQSSLNNNDALFVAGTPMVRRRIVNESTLRSLSISQTSFSSNSADELLTSSFHLDVALAVAATLAGVVLLIASLIMSSTVLLGLGAISSLGGAARLGFFSHHANRNESILVEDMELSMNSLP